LLIKRGHAVEKLNRLSVAVLLKEAAN